MTTITIERELLEQALEALDNSVDVVYEEYTDAVHRYANIPSRKARLDGLAAMAKAHLDTSDAIRAALAAPATAPERKPMHEGEIQAAWLGQDLDEPIPYSFVLGIRSAERFNGIKETP